MRSASAARVTAYRNSVDGASGRWNAAGMAADTAADTGKQLTDVRVDALDARDVSLGDAKALVRLNDAANAVDAPHWPSQTPRGTQLRLRHGWEGQPMHAVLVARAPGGWLRGAAEVFLPYWDNRHVAVLDLQADPADRADDVVADALLAAASHSVRQAGRTSIVSDGWRDSWIAGYWSRQGWPAVSQAAQRRLVTADLDRSRVAELRAEAEARSPGYDVELLPLPTPDSLVDGLLGVHLAMNDAPLDDLQLDDDEWSVERLRTSEAALTARELRVHRMVARRRDDGELAGYTVVIVDEDRPRWAFQEDTSVVRAHRGHRLGLRLKATMLEHLAEVEPQVEAIDTWNAESNAHMIAVNEQLGCVVVGRGVEYQSTLG